MRKIILQIPLSIAISHDKAMHVLCLIVGYTGLFVDSINVAGVSEGILIGLLFSVFGTLCFGLVPILFVSAGIIIRYGSVFALPYLFVLQAGNLFGEQNNLSVSFWLLAIAVTLYGLINVLLARRIGIASGGEWMVHSMGNYPTNDRAFS